MEAWQRVELDGGMAPLEIARVLTQAMALVHQRLAPVMVYYRGEPYAAIVPPDAGLAWSRAGESKRLSDIATSAAGLDPVLGRQPGPGVVRQ